MLAVALIPYPENVTAEVSITDVNQSYIHAETLISYRYITQIKKGAVLQIEIEGYPSREFGYTSGVIASVEDSIVRHDGNNYFRALLSLKRSPKYDVYRNMQGIATITISDHSILQYILGNKSLH